MKRGKTKYTAQMPRRLYSFFSSYSGEGVASFSKFARAMGVTLGELEGWRRHKRFNEAWAECEAIRRDTIIDGALCRRLDSSFAKLLISSEEKEAVSDGALEVRVEVV
ncbi:MAG: hypothetical protein IKC32_04095 [Clostridia bacterium]|nr:hypothetical protein [Clostridia bacterium]